jgi:hypothetical protein
MQLMDRYKQLRRISKKVNNTLVQRIPKDVLEEGGQMLGMLQDGRLVFGGEEESSIFMDYCIHDVRRNGQTVVEKFLDESPYPPGSEEAIVLDSLARAVFSVWVVESCEPGVGAYVRDLVSDEARLIVDVGLSQTAVPEMLLATRLMAVEDISMTTGAPLPIGYLPRDEGAAGLVAGFRRLLGGWQSPQTRSEAIAILICGALDAEAGSHVSYEDPIEDMRHRPRRERPLFQRSPYVPRNGPCTCGSGKKYKNCCAAKR